MQYYKFVTLVFLSIISNNYFINAQQTNQQKHTVALSFDSAGRVISFPPSILREQKKIDPRVVIPSSFFFGEVERLRSLLVKTYETLSEENTFNMYYCFYDKPEFNFKGYLDDLSSAIRCLDEKNFSLSDTSLLMASLKKARYIPAFAFMHNLLNRQYELRIYRGEVLVEKRNLKIVSYDKKQKCFYFGTKEIQIKDLDCRSCGRQPDQLSFRLYKAKPFDLTIKEWFEEKNDELSKKFPDVEESFRVLATTDLEDTTSFNRNVNNLNPIKNWFTYWFWYTGGEIALDPFRTPDAKGLSDSIKIYNKSIDSSLTQKKYYDSLLRRNSYSASELELLQNGLVIKNNLAFIIDSVDAVLSQTKKELATTNPVPSTIRMAQLTTQLRKGMEYRDSVNQQKIFIEGALLKDNNATGKFEVHKLIYPRLQSVTKKIDSLNLILENLTRNFNRKLPMSFNTQPVSYLNRVNLFLSSDNIIVPQIQYDASNSYEGTAKTKRSLNRVTELPDNESGIVIIHNLDSAIKLRFTHTRSSFKDESEFTQLISDQLSKIDLTKLTATELSNVQDITRSFFKTSATKDFAGDTNICQELRMVLYKKFQLLAQDLVAKNSSGVYANSIFSKSEPVVPLYHSESETVKFKSETAYKDSISVTKVLSTKDTVAMQTFVKVGRLKFVQLASGIAVTSKPISVSTIDTSGGFRVSSADNKARAIIGFKIYPFQHYSRDRWLIPRYPLRRFAVFAGFEMLHPLNNFYLGGSYDIVPGLAFSAGSNFYLKTTYKVENNTVTETHKSYDTKGLYYSVTVDPELFVKFIKLLFK